MQRLRITPHAIHVRVVTLNISSSKDGSTYSAVRTGQVWSIYMTMNGSTNALTVADSLTGRECYAMLYGIQRGRQHQHDDRLRSVFGQTA